MPWRARVSRPGRAREATLTCSCAAIQARPKSQLLSYVHKIAPRGVYVGQRFFGGWINRFGAAGPETRELVMESVPWSSVIWGFAVLMSLIKCLI